MLQEKGYPLYKAHGITHDIATGLKMKAVEPYAHMRRFLSAWTEHMLSLNAFAEADVTLE
jgi:hypothetical protein